MKPGGALAELLTEVAMKPGGALAELLTEVATRETALDGPVMAAAAPVPARLATAMSNQNTYTIRK